MKPAALFRDMPIRRKLTLIAVLSVGAALLFAAGVSMIYQWLLLRAELERSLHSQAIIVAANSTSALLFNDPASAAENLEALRAFRNIEFATLYDKQGQLFAAFIAAGSNPAPSRASPEAELHRFAANHLDVIHAVDFEGERVGSLHVRSSLSPIYRQLGWSAAVVAAATLGGLGLAMLLIAYLHPAVTKPMTSLVRLMSVISSEKNYGLRAELHGTDELGTLAREFNGMLEQIQARDDALARHRENLEHEVAKRTASLAEAQHIARLGSWDWEIAGDVLSWSDEVYHIFGLVPQQFGATYEAFMQVVHPDDRQSVEAAIRHAVEQGQVYGQDHRILLPDGTVRHVHEQGEVSRGKDGRAIRMVGTVMDITERKQLEIDLRRRTAFFEALVTTSADGILVVDTQGRKVVQNRRMIELLKIPDDIAADPDDGPQVQFVINQVVDPEQFADKVRHLYAHPEETSEDEIVLKDGTIFDRYSAPVLDSEGHPYGRIWAFRDITGRKHAEERIRRLNEELESKVQERTRQLLEAQEELVRKEKLAVLGQVAGSVGHELRNPLGVMNNAVYFLQTVLSDADDITREYLDILKEEIAGSERIVSDLLDSVRTKPPHPETVGIATLIEQTLHKYAVPPGITVRLELPDSLPALEVDPQQIHQVFRNLISNGVEAMAAGGELEIRAVENAAEGKVAVSVRDTGSGIPPDVLPRLFQPLFTTKPRGIGLGLVVVKNLTESNGGTLTVQTEVGRGTTFTVTLPAARSAGGGEA
jgi:PAS domain S-box-containing protein